MKKPWPPFLPALLSLFLFTACAEDTPSPEPVIQSAEISQEVSADNRPLPYIRYSQTAVRSDYLTAHQALPLYRGAPAEIGDVSGTGAPEPPDELPVEESPINIPRQRGEIDLSRPVIALTFDDGPSKHTARILDVLELYNARATFFTIGNLLENRETTVLRAFDMGCEILGHSWDHRNMTKLSEEDIRTQILTTNSAIEAITGVYPMMYRPPYGAVNDRVKSVSADLGFAIINWSVDPWDWKIRDAGAVYAAVVNTVKDRSIVLSHDLYGTTADAMERVIPDLIAQGYQLVTVSELLSLTYGELEPGRVYTNG